VSSLCGEDAAALQQLLMHGVATLRNFIVSSNSVNVRSKTLFVAAKFCRQSAQFASAIRDTGVFYLEPVLASICEPAGRVFFQES
jgi:hypothetical protein